MKPPEDFGPLEEAQQLLRTEVQRAMTLFPKDECETICEVLRRAQRIPELKRVLLIHGAFMAVAEAVEAGGWMSRLKD